jgi:DNA replication protein DnaC
MSQEQLSKYWSDGASFVDAVMKARQASGEIQLPDTEALRKYADELRKDTIVHPAAQISEERMSEIMYSRAQKLMFIKSKRVEPFHVDDHNRDILRALKLYALNDKRFEEEGHGSLSKGIALFGLQGCGKTMILKILADAGTNMKHQGILNSIQELKRFGWGDQVSLGIYNINDMYSCVGIEHQYRQKETGEQYLNNLIKIKRPIALDDLGFERSETMNFGNRINIMEIVLQHRYDHYLETGVKTHLSSNLVNADKLEEIYGTRIRGRIREMCNCFYFDTEHHKDRRS